VAQRVLFFFEKRNEETFADVQTDKSFLLLFFKKEGLLPRFPQGVT
jgi:hypothetical protein